MTEPEKLIGEFLELARIDWYVSTADSRLHWAELDDEQKDYIPDCWGVPVPVRLACGRTARWLNIPGIFTRLGAQRCKGCCRATGCPEGKGSPKNDDACAGFLERAA